MSEYKVIKYFTDLQDNNYAYHVGDTYPREGIDPKPSRIAELSSTSNKRGVPLIELVKESKAKTKAKTVAPVKEKDEEVAPVVETEDVALEATEPTPVKKGGRPKKKSE